MPEPRTPLFWLALAPLVLSVLAGLDRSLWQYLWMVNGGLLAVASLDAILLVRARVSVTRSHGGVMAQGRPSVVTLGLRATSTAALVVEVHELLFDGAEAPELPIRVTLLPGVPKDVTYTVVPRRRGEHELESPIVKMESPLSLWARRQVVQCHDVTAVYPDLGALRAFEQAARRGSDGVVLQAARQLGSNNEFEQLRDYGPDDDYRSIDWQATARRRRLTTREYRRDSDQTLIFALAAGSQMTAEHDSMPLFDWALDATLQTAQAALRAGDHVGLLCFDERVRRALCPVSGSRAMTQLVRASFSLSATSRSVDYDRAYEELHRMTRRRALVVLFATAVDSTTRAAVTRVCRALTRRHLVLLASASDPDVETIAAERLVEPDGRALYAKAAAAELLSARRLWLGQLKRLGVHVLDAPAHELPVGVLQQYLVLKAAHAQ